MSLRQFETFIQKAEAGELPVYLLKENPLEAIKVYVQVRKQEIKFSWILLLVTLLAFIGISNWLVTREYAPLWLSATVFTLAFLWIGQYALRLMLRSDRKMAEKRIAAEVALSGMRRYLDIPTLDKLAELNLVEFRKRVYEKLRLIALYAETPSDTARFDRIFDFFNHHGHVPYSKEHFLPKTVSVA